MYKGAPIMKNEWSVHEYAPSMKIFWSPHEYTPSMKKGWSFYIDIGRIFEGISQHGWWNHQGWIPV